MFGLASRNVCGAEAASDHWAKLVCPRLQRPALSAVVK
jgi:hypothetical protein